MLLWPLTDSHTSSHWNKHLVLYLLDASSQQKFLPRHTGQSLLAKVMETSLFSGFTKSSSTRYILFKNPFRWLHDSSCGAFLGFRKYFFTYYNQLLISLPWAFLLTIEASSRLSIGTVLGSLKAPTPAGAIDPCFHHSWEGYHSKACLVPVSLLLPSRYTQLPETAEFCTYAGGFHPAVQRQADWRQQWNSKAPGCIWTTSNCQDKLSGKGEYILHLKVVWLTVSLSPLHWSEKLKIRGLEAALFLLQCNVLGFQHFSGAKMSSGVEMNGVHIFLGNSSQRSVWKNTITKNFHQPIMCEQVK